MKMDKNIEQIIKQKDILNTLSNCKIKLRKSIINNSDKNLIEAICQCVLNLLQGNINLSATQKTALSKYKKYLRKLVEKSPLKDKKKILIQKGGFLQYLIPAAIEGISLLISNLVKKE